MQTKPAKIAFVSDAVFPFNRGGKETRIHNLTKGLTALGCEVHIFTMQWWKEKGDYSQDGITYHAISKQYPLYAGGRRSIKQGLLFGIACLKLVRYDFDILEVDHMPFFPLYAAKVVSVLKRRPLYATWHEVWGRAYWQQYLGVLSGQIAYYIERLSVTLPDHIVAVSSHTEERLREILHYKGDLSMVTNGIDYKAILPIPVANKASDIIYVGRLLPHKNVGLLIEAIGILKKQAVEARCYIVGDGPELNRLKKLIVKKGLSENITMTGFMKSSDEVFSLMKASKVFVLPSVREGFGITVLEAYACGLSVVTLDHPDNAAQYIAPKESSIICKPTAVAIAAAIESLLERKNTVTFRGDAATYDWENLAASQKKVYAI